MYRLAYRNFGDHEALVVNHSVVAGATSGVRWYEVRSPSTVPTVYQSGTYAPSDGKWRWMGSVAMDAVGDIAVGYSKSSSTAFPSINYTGRLSTDPLGILETEATLFAGAGSQTRRLSRWGDYSAMSIDPVDDCTFWYTNEYLPANGSFNWSTRIGNFKFPGCVTEPSGLSATGASSSQINLNWNSVAGATGYSVERSPDGSIGWAQIGTTGTNSYSDTGLPPSTTFFYRVRSTTSTTSSAPSNVASTTTLAPVGSATFEDNSANVGYTGNWTLLSNPGFSGGTAHYSSEVGATMTLNFTGQYVGVVYLKDTNLGIATIKIDGVVVDTLDTYAAVQAFQQAKFYSVAPGPHSISVSPSGTKNASSTTTVIAFDAFIAQASP
jgi:hypothetical protein